MQELLARLVSEPQAVDLVEALLPRQPVGAPDRAVLAHAAADEVDDLRLEVFRHPRVHAEPDVVPLVADADQLLDPRPAGVRAEDPERREVRGDLVEVHGPAVLARHGLEHGRPAWTRARRAPRTWRRAGTSSRRAAGCRSRRCGRTRLSCTSRPGLDLGLQAWL